MNNPDYTPCYYSLLYIHLYVIIMLIIMSLYHGYFLHITSLSHIYIVNN